MAGTNGFTLADLSLLTSEMPDQMSFFQLIRLIEAVSGERLGTATAPADEPIRLKAAVNNRYPGSDFSLVKEGMPPIARLNHFGLTGPSGTLPPLFREAAIEAQKSGNTLYTEFLNLFNHRFASFHYRAWAKPQRLVEAETVARKERRTDKALAAVAGLGDVLDGHAPPNLAGAFQRRSSAAGLKRLISARLGVPAEVDEFVGTWVRVDPSDQTRLGGSYCRLGEDAVLGTQSWSVGRTVRVRVGPIKPDLFRALVDGSPEVRRTQDEVTLALGLGLDCQTQVSIERKSAPKIKLGETRNGSRLGLGSWLFGGDPDALLADTVLKAETPRGMAQDRVPAQSSVMSEAAPEQEPDITEEVSPPPAAEPATPPEPLEEGNAVEADITATEADAPDDDDLWG